MPVDKKGLEIREGSKVKFKRPVWNTDGLVEFKEVFETVRRLDSGELYANNREEDCFYISFSEMEIVS